jgi:hypothetical protein
MTFLARFLPFCTVCIIIPFRRREEKVQVKDYVRIVRSNRFSRAIDTKVKSSREEKMP